MTGIRADDGDGIEVIRLSNGDLCARNSRGKHVAIAGLATQPNSPGFTPAALRERARAYEALALAAEQSWDEYAEHRHRDLARIDGFLDRHRTHPTEE